MARNTQHDLLTTPNSDVRARQRFVLQFKREVERIRRRSRAIYNTRLEPALEKIAPPDPDKWVLENLYKDPTYKTICALKLTGQEMMWAAIKAAIDPEKDRISDLYNTVGDTDTLGSLTLNPALDISPVWHASRIHLQPDGYHVDKGNDDLTAGAFYEEGGALYSRGQGVGTRESKAECIIRFIRDWKPDFKPLRILDCCCSVGASSTPYAEAFPEAEIHAIDIAPGMLRYAHARAELLGNRVHFHQMDAGATAFEDQSFDLVVSHNAMHEMPSPSQAAMFSESFRLLKPGGLCIHQDVPLRFDEKDSFEKAELLFDKWFNGELYWSDYAENNCEELLDQAGFPAQSRRCGFFAQLDNTMRWYVAAAQKP